MPPLALVRWTTRSVLTRISAPSMAPTPVTSSMTPTLIGVPVGAPAAAGAVVAAAAGADVAAAGAVVAAAAGAVVGLAGAVVGAAAAGAVVGGAGGAAGVAAGLEHAARTQAIEPTNIARWLRVGAKQVILGYSPCVLARVAPVTAPRRFLPSAPLQRPRALRRLVAPVVWPPGA